MDRMRTAWPLALATAALLVLAGCGRHGGGGAASNAAKEHAADVAGAQALVAQGQAHLKKREWDAALDCFEHALIKDEDNSEAYYGRGRVRLEFSQPNARNPQLNEPMLDQAIADFTKTIEMDKQSQKALARRGEARMRRGVFAIIDQSREDEARKDLDAALVDLNAALELNPRDPLSLLNRGRVHQAFKEYSDAIADYEAAINLSSSMTEARKYRDECKREMGTASGDLPARGNETENAHKE